MSESNLIPVIFQCSSLSLDHKWQAQTFCVSELILYLTVLICRENCTVCTSSGPSKLHFSASRGNRSFISSPYSEHWKSWMKWHHNFFQNPVLCEWEIWAHASAMIFYDMFDTDGFKKFLHNEFVFPIRHLHTIGKWLSDIKGLKWSN